VRSIFSYFAGSMASEDSSGTLADYTTTIRVFPMSLIAVVIGIVACYVALGLLKLIWLFTNLFFYLHWSFDATVPSNNHLGPWVIVVPVVGSLIVGFMSRYGSERIRGHGIPEALEAILLKGSRVEPRVAILKPLGSAIAIGSGGPFGAEGPIIMTGGAFGSLIAQFFHLSDSERKTLLVAGASAGMAAIFASPIAAVLLATELLLFEFKPRSLVPVALASATSAACRRYLIGLGPLFPTTPHSAVFAPSTLGICLLLGAASGLLAIVLSHFVYLCEDGFRHLPIHWMWWPALGGIVVGLGGYIYPRALGVGYDVIADMLKGNTSVQLVLGILVVKSIIWAVSLGSGNSGGTLAPLLMMGGALGIGFWYVFPAAGSPFYVLVAMSATLGAALGVPITAIVFAIELTHDINMLLPLLLTVIVAYTLSVLLLRRSILTEKIARRGLHLSREYAMDPLEIMFVREVMRTSIVALPAEANAQSLADSINESHGRGGQWIYPIVNQSHEVLGVLSRRELQQLISHGSDHRSFREIVSGKPPVIYAYPDEPLRVVVYRMAQHGITRFPVIDRRGGTRGRERDRGTGTPSPKLVGLVALPDLLKARVANLEAEIKREQVLPWRIFPLRFRPRTPTKPAA
jgi:H+/Cl- antiporter ClcA